MRTHYCGDLREQHIGQSVTLCGWVHRRRDHGGVIFLDMRDRAGIVQVVFDPDTQDAFALADKVRSEYVLKITGRVRMRDEAVRNTRIATGTIEVLGKQIEILNGAETPPFPIDEYASVGEEVRLRHRYLDLRRPEMIERFRFRSKVTSLMRQYLDANGFLDVETPILTRATPEGARDYLVPSRTHPGQFFALPQSPQLFKQLLMVAGFDRYYQVAKCFRDEDLRADRQPEFTQIDLEMSFVNEEDVMGRMMGRMGPMGPMRPMGQRVPFVPSSPPHRLHIAYASRNVGFARGAPVRPCRTRRRAARFSENPHPAQCTSFLRYNLSIQKRRVRKPLVTPAG